MLGFALLGMAVGSLLGLPISGVLSSRFGSRKTATVAIFALLLATPLPLAAPNLPLFVIALALLGIANGAVDVAMNAHAVVVEQRFGRPIMSGLHALFSAGGLAGAAAAGLAMSAGLSPQVHLLVIVAGLLVATLAAVTFLLPIVPSEIRRTRFRVPRGPLLWLGVLTMCALMAEGAIGDWAAVYLRDDLRSDPALAALGFAAFSLAMAAGRFGGDNMVRRYGGPAVLATDTLVTHGGELAQPSTATIQALNAFLPAAWSHNNPIDILGDAPPERYAKALLVCRRRGGGATGGNCHARAKPAHCDRHHVAQLFDGFWFSPSRAAAEFALPGFDGAKGAHPQNVAGIARGGIGDERGSAAKNSQPGRFGHRGGEPGTNRAVDSRGNPGCYRWSPRRFAARKKGADPCANPLKT